MDAGIEKLKNCTKCLIEKPFSQFRALKRAPDGKQWQCKGCQDAYRKRHYEENREHVLEVNRKWATDNKERAQARQKRWLENNREHHSRWGKEWYRKNKEGHNAHGRLWYQQNKEKRSRTAARWYALNKDRKQQVAKRWARRNPEKRKELTRRWRKANPHVVREMAMRRYAAKGNATPKWLTAEHRKQILEVYQTACLLSAFTGELHHVDHIVPLRGKDVCGLHVPWNLQILTATENLKKGNRYEA